MQTADFEGNLMVLMDRACEERVMLTCAEALPRALSSIADRRRTLGAMCSGGTYSERGADPGACAYTMGSRARVLSSLSVVGIDLKLYSAEYYDGF